MIIEPLDPARHGHADFSCGIAQVYNFLRRTANKLSKAGNVRTFVMTGHEGELVGFYALNAHAIGYADLPDRFARSRRAHGSIPAAYIPMIDVDRRQEGKGYGSDLLIDALTRLATNTVERSIRPIALNRKNALFAGSDEGGGNRAVIATLIENCKLSGINPHNWLTRTLVALANGHPVNRLAELMPWIAVP